MKPDSVTFLLAIRHELRAADFFKDKLSSGAAPIIVQRAAEVLAHLALQSEAKADARAKAKPALLTLLQDIHQHAAASVASIAKAAEAAAPAAASDDNELETAIAMSLRTVSATLPGGAADKTVEDFYRRLASIERGIHQQHEKDIAAMLAAADADWPAEVSTTPSDADVTALLRQGLSETPFVEASNVQRHSGFNSKEIFFLDIKGRPGWPVKSVIRREPPYNITGAAVADERDLMEQLRSIGVPVPQVLHARHATGESGGLIITERMIGKTFGPTELALAGSALSQELAAIAARIHGAELSGHLSELTCKGQSATQRMLEAIHRYYDRWTALRSEDSAIIEAAYQWLLCNVDKIRSKVGLVHGDFNLRNILIADNRISAVLDWELSHAGDVAEDLAHLRPDLEEAGTWQLFLAEYNKHVSDPITVAELEYPSVYVAFWQAVLSSLALAGLPLKKSRNFIFGSIAFIEHKTNCQRLATRLANAGRLGSA